MPTRVRPNREEAFEVGQVEVADWDDVAPGFIDAWEQGEHLILLGKTGRGKTTFAFEALTKRWERRKASICVFVTKKRDDTTAKLHWPTISAWPPSYQIRQKRRVVLWPPYTKASTYPRDVRPIFLEALDKIMDEGNWTLYMDEASYAVQSLGLRTSMDELFTQSRSNGITLLAGSQRPVWVSRGQLTQHVWCACFKIGDQDEAKRAGEVLGDRNRWTDVILNLGEHEFLLVNTLTEEGVVSQIRR